MEKGSAEKGLQEGVGSGANQRLGRIIWALLRKKAECSLLLPHGYAGGHSAQGHVELNSSL